MYSSDTDKSRDPYQLNQVVENPVPTIEGPIEKLDPLSLDGIEDKDLIKNANERFQASSLFFDKRYDLTNRRARNEKYLFGRQIEEKEKDKNLKAYEVRYLDNVIYEIEESIVPLAMSRPPEMIVYAGNDSDEAKDSAKTLTKVINEDFKSRMIRDALEMSFRHVPVYFNGVIKCRWNTELNNG